MIASATTRTECILRMHVTHASAGQHLPALNRVVVIVRVEAALLYELFARWLNISAFIRAPGLQDGLASIPSPGMTEACVRVPEHRFIQASVRPVPAPIG